MRDTMLFALAQCPFLAADDLALYAGIGRPSATKALLRLRDAGEAARLALPDRHRHVYLYYLTARGVAAAAAVVCYDPAALSRRFRLSEAQLRQRLPLLHRLVAGRRLLLTLQQELVAAGGDLRDWLAYPAAWYYTEDKQRHVYRLDGYGIVAPPTGPGWPVGYLWDGEAHEPPAFLHHRLTGLDAVRAAPEYGVGARVAVPPVLLVTADAARVPRAYRPGLLWTTTAEIARAGVLAAPWQGPATARGGPAPLLEALARLVAPGLYRTPSDVVPPPRQTSRGRDPAPRPVGRRRAAGTLAEQAAAQVQPPFPARPGHPDLVSYALRDAAHALLHAVGAHPGLTAADLAVACDAPVRHVRRRLRVCSAQALVTSWIVDPSAGRRYGLTARGLRVLAARSAVPPGLYARVHGLLDDKAADRNDTGHLARLRRHAAHTAAVNAVYLAVLTAARAAGGSLVWRGEWVCRHEYQFPAPGSAGGWGADPAAPRVRHGTLYPDAEMLYGGPAPARRRLYYIEVDRDTEGLTGARGLEAKFTRYLDYRRDLARRADRLRPVTILFVTTTARRAAAALALSERLAIERREAPLDLHVMTLAALEQTEPGQPIWQDLSGVPHGIDGAESAARRSTAAASRRACSAGTAASPASRDYT